MLRPTVVRFVDGCVNSGFVEALNAVLVVDLC